jgi:NhaA family Na+:H+ antiporter
VAAWLATASSGVVRGVAAGLILGKPLGTCQLAGVRLHLCELPSDAGWGHILGIGLLGGIGFTVSLLIAGLAFDDEGLIDEAKLGILVASIFGAVLGYLFLRVVARPRAR